MSSNHRAQFIPARDSRNRRIPGLYIRGGRYYAQLWVDLGNGKKAARKFPLRDGDDQPVRNFSAAREALEIKRHERRENQLPTIGHKPRFSDYCATYFNKAKVQRKRPDTVAGERQALARWCDHLGHVRIDQIATPIISGFIDKRLKGGKFCGRRLAGISERTANLDLMRLRNVLKCAMDDGYIRELPRMKMLDEAPPPKRNLVTPAEFDRLIGAAQSACDKNGKRLADYLRFLAFSGAREQEALHIKWADVDFERERVTIGANELTKNWESRAVEFNPQLGALLREMHAQRAPDCSWLFPSPQRGSRDEHAKSFRESLKLARKAAELEWVGFHDLRHYFCSVCVMAGIDFMTIAAWLGHKDGGILVGKVYGHLLDEHRQKAAKRVHFGISVVDRNASGRTD
ncbi:MAG TPA: site-specific integrase [Chthoniobacterales bacterium]|jgi:integrase|nr:site-specific integrase [Chthoniobacterales bacterium]